MWKNEAAFSKAIMRKLQSEGVSCMYRLESHSTANGIPDFWFSAGGDDYFIEFKNNPKASINDEVFKVAWRPGQQRFAQEYWQSHGAVYDGCAFRKCTWTLMGCSDGYILIPMTRMFMNNIVANKYVTKVQNKNAVDLFLTIKLESWRCICKPEDVSMESVLDFYKIRLFTNKDIDTGGLNVSLEDAARFVYDCWRNNK